MIASSHGVTQSPYVRDAIVPAPVGLVIVRTPATVNAMTVSFFSEVAHYPTSMWIAIAPGTYTHELLLTAGRFAFITLHCAQAAVAVRCGTVSGREHDKASGLGLHETSDGFLFLPDALASTACVVDQQTSVGDHTLFIARMLSGELSPRRTADRQLLLSDLAAE